MLNSFSATHIRTWFNNRTFRTATGSRYSAEVAWTPPNQQSRVWIWLLVKSKLNFNLPLVYFCVQLVFSSTSRKGTRNCETKNMFPSSFDGPTLLQSSSRSSQKVHLCHPLFLSQISCLPPFSGILLLRGLSQWPVLQKYEMTLTHWIYRWIELTVCEGHRGCFTQYLISVCNHSITALSNSTRCHLLNQLQETRLVASSHVRGLRASQQQAALDVASFFQMPAHLTMRARNCFTYHPELPRPAFRSYLFQSPFNRSINFVLQKRRKHFSKASR